MKFREYVGEKKLKEVKRKIVQTNIDPTEENFLKHVARENNETYFGFGLNKKVLKSVFDYIKSWLIRYDIQFKSINPYLTLYILENLPTYSKIINNVKKTKRGVIYNPLGTITVTGKYIALNYVKDVTYESKLQDIFDSMGIEIISSSCYVNLFKIESKKTLKNYQFYDMMYSCPKIPYLRLGNIGIRRKHGSI